MNNFVNNPTNTMNYCINCAYYDDGNGTKLFPTCRHPQAETTHCDLVRGDTHSYQNECQIMRRPNYPCGENGAKFRPKTPLPPLPPWQDLTLVQPTAEDWDNDHVILVMSDDHARTTTKLPEFAQFRFYQRPTREHLWRWWVSVQVDDDSSSWPTAYPPGIRVPTQPPS